MFTRSGISAALLLSLLVPAAASAQSAADRPGIVFFANGGGNTAVTELDDAGAASFKTGWTAGGGVGWQINPYLAVRGTFDFARNKGDDNSTTFAGERLNRYFYGGDVQLRYPTASGFAPYLLAGAGAVTIDNKDDPTFDKFTKFAGKGGLGLEYVPRGSKIGFFAQGTTYIYKFDRNGFDKTQADLLWTAGLSFRL